MQNLGISILEEKKVRRERGKMILLQVVQPLHLLESISRFAPRCAWDVVESIFGSRFVLGAGWHDDRWVVFSVFCLWHEGLHLGGGLQHPTARRHLVIRSDGRVGAVVGL